MKSLISTITNIKKKISKTISVLATTAIVASTTLVPLSTDAASNDFITKLSDGSGISIDASQIKGIVTMPKTTTYPLSLNVSTYCISANGKISTTPGQMMILNLTINGITESTAQKLELATTSSYITSDKSNMFQAVISKSKNIRKNGNNSYTITFEFESYGNELAISISHYDSTDDDPKDDLMINEKDFANIKSVSAELKDNPNFVSVQARGPIGYESFVAAVPKCKASKKDYISWAKYHCLFVNSLSDMTCIKKDTIFAEFYGCSSCFIYKLDTGWCDKFAIASIGESGTNTVISFLENEDPDIPKICHEEVHEISHSYCTDYEKVDNTSVSLSGYDAYPIGYEPKIYKRNNFASYYAMNEDDIFTNIRGITAIQHCKQLRDAMYITRNAEYDYKTGEYGKPKYEGKYYNYLQKDFEYILNDPEQYNWRSWDSDYNDQRAHWFNTAISRIATSKNDWITLKEFFRGEKPQNISSDVYKWFGKYIFGNNTTEFNGINLNLALYIDFPNNISYAEEKMKIVNITYRLWQLYEKQSNFNEKSYEAFLNNYFDKSVLKTFVS